jgi:hypothetical protein
MNGESKWIVRWTANNSGSANVENNPNYTIVDLQPNTLYEICVKAICAPGVESDSTCISAYTGLHDISLTTGLQLYPNPTTGELQIMNYELREADKVEIYNLLGQQQQFSITNTEHPTIDVSHLSAGMYTLKIGGYVGKFVKK